MTSTQTIGRTQRTAAHRGYDVLPRRERRAVSFCDIWDLVAPGEPCPTCEDTFEERLARARSGNN